MTTQCPRCGTPRLGDYPICQGCGLDFRLLAAPTVCLRCHAPLYPGYTRCSSCGFENGAGWGAPAASASSRHSTRLIAVAVLGLALLVVAGALVIVIGHGSSAGAVPSDTPTGVVTEPPPGVTSTSSATGSAAVATAEPSPVDSWTAYTSPDGKWSARFPGLSSPRKTSQTVNTGTSEVAAAIYAVEDMNGAVYGVEVADLPSTYDTATDTDAKLASLVVNLSMGFGGKVADSRASTEAGVPARDAAITAAGYLINLRIWFVGSRMYALLTEAAPGIAVYPKHFYAEFALR